jgi:hypothetical protein
MTAAFAALALRALIVAVLHHGYTAAGETPQRPPAAKAPSTLTAGQVIGPLISDGGWQGL